MGTGLVRGLLVLLLCQLAGEVISRVLALPVPGPVLGLALLVPLLKVRDRRALPVRQEVERVADGLLATLGLLFVPAGVGIVQYGGVLADHAIVLALVLTVSTALTMLATVATFLLVKRRLATQ